MFPDGNHGRPHKGHNRLILASLLALVFYRAVYLSCGPLRLDDLQINDC